MLERDLAMPAYLQIAHALIDAIRRGRLASGSALPGTRELALRVGVNRKTIQQSYDELVAQGWLTAEPTRGTFVSALLPVVPWRIKTALRTTPLRSRLRLPNRR